jgi:hypothetical protein
MVLTFLGIGVFKHLVFYTQNYTHNFKMSMEKLRHIKTRKRKNPPFLEGFGVISGLIGKPWKYFWCPGPESNRYSHKAEGF